MNKTKTNCFHSRKMFVWIFYKLFVFQLVHIRKKIITFIPWEIQNFIGWSISIENFSTNFFLKRKPKNSLKISCWTEITNSSFSTIQLIKLVNFSIYLGRNFFENNSSDSINNFNLITSVWKVKKYNGKFPR